MKISENKPLSVLRKSVALPLFVAVMLLAFVLPTTAAAAGERDQFEQQLQDQFPGTFKLYRSLGDNAKMKVFKAYSKTDEEAGIGRFSTVIAKILELSVVEDQSAQRKN